jgi:Cu(I)/Ag(I) efflux system membrane protein CusA/SilA
MKARLLSLVAALLTLLATRAVTQVDTLRVAEALRIAHEANPMLRGARASATAARERVGPAGALPDPQLQKLRLVVPLTLGIIFLLLYFNFRGVEETLLVMLALPFALVGGIWSLWALGYNTSVAVWVGLIALAGVAAETGVVMLIYLDEAFQRRRKEGTLHGPADVAVAVAEGAVQRLRPVMMTVTAVIAGLAPILWSAGTGADVMKRIAAPMVGGMVTATVLTLVVIPAVYYLWRGWQVKKHPLSRG